MYNEVGEDIVNKDNGMGITYQNFNSLESPQQGAEDQRFDLIQFHEVVSAEKVICRLYVPQVRYHRVHGQP